jgi:hypothetical protein
MPFPPREKNMPFYEERSKKAIFENRHSLFSFEKNYMKGGSFANARKSISIEAHQGAQKTFSRLHRNEK